MKCFKPLLLPSVAISLTMLLTACRPPVIFDSFFVEENVKRLASINIVDQNGVSETISNIDRLKQYETVNFLTCQPFKRVLRVYQRDNHGNISACAISYHDNGQPKQYLDIINGRAFGAYREWHNNGAIKVEAYVIGGQGDLSPGVEKSWLFEGNCFAWNEEGTLLAIIPYSKGKLEGVALYYHAKSGALWKKVPYQNGNIEGVEEIFFENGAIFETTEWVKGHKNGLSKRFWQNGTIATEEIYSEDKLLSGLYYDFQGELISEVKEGCGFKSLFGKYSLKEQREYIQGVQEGLVRVFDKNGGLLCTYNVKNNVKNGEEIHYYPTSLQPQLSITWLKGKIHGLTRTWFQNGQPESQREMAGNKKSGLLTAWYEDGSLMLLEEYNQDKLVRGDYYERGSSLPVSSVEEGKGIATFYTSEGTFLRTVNYRFGRPDE